MDRFDIRRVAMGLTAYAIERQHSYERHQPEGAPPWAEQRRLWTDAILQGMARLDGLAPDPRLMEQFDRELEQARGCYFFTPATQQMQKDTIRELRRFVAAMEAAGDDRRRQVNVVRELLEDMSLHPHWWNGKDNGLDLTRDEAERALVRMTAQMPIRFTRILLGGDAGPHWAGGFVPGSVTDEEAVRQTSVYLEAVRDYPEVTEWPALCTVYAGRGLPTALGTVDASDFDLEIMNRTGDRFLDECGVRWLGGPYQMTIAALPEMISPSGMQKEQDPLLQGSRLLVPDDLAVYEHFSSEDDCLTFCLDLLADEETVFGRQLSSEQEGSYVMTYAVYDEATGQVRDTLDVELRLPHDEKWFHCQLSPEVTDSLKQKMDDFCVAMYGEHLPEPPAQRRNGPATFQTGPTM